MRRRSLPLLETLQIASPCAADWELMVGDDRKRFCKACEKHVYNLPLLEPEELVELIESTEGSFCGRLYARTDGTVLTADCPIGVAAKLAAARRRRVAGAAAAIAGLMVSATGALFGLAYLGTSIDPMVAGGISAIPPPPLPPQVEAPATPERPQPEDRVWIMGVPALPEPRSEPLQGEIKVPPRRHQLGGVQRRSKSGKITRSNSSETAQD